MTFIRSLLAVLTIASLSFTAQAQPTKEQCQAAAEMTSKCGIELAKSADEKKPAAKPASRKPVAKPDGAKDDEIARLRAELHRAQQSQSATPAGVVKVIDETGKPVNDMSFPGYQGAMIVIGAQPPAPPPAPNVSTIPIVRIGQGTAPAPVVTTPPPSAPVLPNGEPVLQGSGNIHYRNPVTGQTVSGTVSSPEEARKWVEQQVAECTRQLRAKPGANPDASCNNTRRVN